MSFHELLQMDCDFDLMICNNGVQDFAMSATGLEQESFPAHAHRSISNVKCFNHSSCKLSKLDSATWAESYQHFPDQAPLSQSQHLPNFQKN